MSCTVSNNGVAAKSKADIIREGSLDVLVFGSSMSVPEAGCNCMDIKGCVAVSIIVRISALLDADGGTGLRCCTSFSSAMAGEDTIMGVSKEGGSG